MISVPNLHPPLTSFPVALIVVGLGLELIASTFSHGPLKFSALIIVSLAAFFTILTYVSGYHGIQFVSPEQLLGNEDSLERHQLFGKLMLFLSVVTAALGVASHLATERRRLFRGLYWGMLFLCTVGILYTASLGGALVYDLGFGVK
ncbi:MAG: hypothetical protein KDD62_06985 [Bdellovibrionales bacterium]|nr:hypothetical protein [Bdellovibrionales bacterium]